MKLFDTSLVFAAALMASFSHSQTSSNFPPFTTKQGALDAEGLPTSGAMVCVLPKRSPCFTMPSEPFGKSADALWEFGLMPRAERLPLSSGGSWLFFSAQFSGGGSGTLDRLAVLRYDRDAEKLTNLLPFVGVTNISERAMWTLPQVSGAPVLVTADFIWAADETHFDPHAFTVNAWVYDVGKDVYTKRMSFSSREKFCSDCEHPGSVLKTERAEILRRLGATPTR